MLVCGAVIVCGPLRAVGVLFELVYIAGVCSGSLWLGLPSFVLVKFIGGVLVMMCVCILLSLQNVVMCWFALRSCAYRMASFAVHQNRCPVMRSD